MPLLKIETNTCLDDSRRDATLKTLSSEIAAALGKPDAYVMVKIEADSLMSFAGTSDPCAYGTVVSLGLDDEIIPQLSHSLSDAIGKALSVNPERIYLRFESPERKHFAHNGKPFG